METREAYPLPDLDKSPLNPYKYRCLLMKNRIRVLLVSINDVPEDFEGKPVDKNGQLDIVSDFNKKYCTDLANREPHRLMTGTDIYNSHVKSTNECISKQVKKTKKKSRKKKDTEEEKEFIGAMALVVGVGDVSDPEQLYGMAHLTEHSVFLGSKKYPKASQIFEFAKTNEGIANASTGFFSTDYFISAKSKEVYIEAIDRVADMIANPILNPKLIQNEVNAVDCEFVMRQRRSSIGLLQILRSLTHPDNPMHRFTCGNRNTLNHPNLGEKLKAWKGHYYVGNLMTLTLVSTLSLDEMENLAVLYFSKIEAGEKILESLPWSILKNSYSQAACPHFHNLYRVYTEKHTRDFLVNFSLSPDLWKQVGVRPFRFISFIILNRGPNSLRTFLNRNGYSVDFYCGPLEKDMCFSEFNSFFSILVVMSMKGLQNFELILEAVFAYIRLIQGITPPVWFYNEMQRFQEQKFHYAYQTNNIYSRRAMSRAVLNSHLMQGIPTWRILSSRILMAHLDEELVTKILKQLIPERANIVVTSQCFKSIADKKERHYKYSYHQEKISDDLMKRMVASNLKFELPKPNPYLDLLIGRICKGGPYSRPPKSTEIGDKAIILCLRMEEPKYGLLAKTKTAMFIKSEVIDRWEPTQRNIILELMAYLLELEINLKHKPASGSLVKINAGTRGETLAFFIHSPAQFLIPVFTDIFRIFYEFEKNFIADCFDAKKDKIVDTLRDKWMDDETYGQLITNYIFNGEFDSYTLMKHRLAELKWPAFTKKVEEFRKKFFLTVCLEGCVESCQVGELANVINGLSYEAPGKDTGVPMYACVSNRVSRLDRGERTFRIQCKLDISEVSFIKDHYQFDRTVKSEFVESLAILLNLTAFSDLRTAQQLGYHVKALPITIDGVPIITIEILTRAFFFHVGYVNERIKVFIREFYENNVQSQKNFAAFVSNKSEEHKNMNWGYVKRIFEDYLLPTGRNYRNLCLEIYGPGADRKSKPRDATNPHHKMGSARIKAFSAALGSFTIITSPSTKKREEKYYILNLDRYKNTLSQFAVDAACEEQIASPFENAEGESSDEDNN